MSELGERQRDLVERLAERLEIVREEGGTVVALTGAGASTESGIPDFRSPNAGLWEDQDPMEVASVEGFRRHPRRFYEFWARRFEKLGHAHPNAAHLALAALEGSRMLRAVVTQNIDGLHQRAGSERVLEVHGSYRQARCMGCGRVEPLDAVVERVRSGRMPVCPVCGELVKPDVVLYGETLPPAFVEAERLVAEASLLIVLGSSLTVHPVAGLVSTARAVAIVNREPGPYDDLADIALLAELGPTMRALAERLGLDLG